ncbi:hypothetical protein ANS017_26310 [Paraclostridium bifermentans]|uniref:hypothetical protein n=1 Tax=Paraclostridium bifermentans TaxID=1490 RepID=UPI000DF846B2|nr:hypothetical protein [Paraclostridium bifermentans]RDC49354.1 hypothetical protein DVA85_24235 [Acinetobacter sp. RIT592]UOW66876.1 hypothetical protein MTR78_09965 [Paraclostridium bifermentans]GKZ04060.1 hypothetical protein ANS014_24940 [Paraclostridium bifermentans]GKZ05565.1 hypothetical protein ANS015_04480 [Paraclostridium bifermentans]GKZ11247.1 hypothetical protein ANS017_26310 [Paraclostridium bifermentans]
MDKKELFKKVEGKLHNYKYLEMQINNIELDIKKEKMEYRGCGAISYDERSGVTYNISRSVENEVIAKEKRISKLMQNKLEKEIEKQKIENALSCLDANETNFFELFYNSKSKNNMKYISMKLHMDRSHCYTVRERLVYKIMGMLYPTYEDLPLFN